MTTVQKDMSVAVEPITGRYLNVSLYGRNHRIYVEEAGQGIPLVCLHTAGADTRQYRAVMNDAWILDRFRVICFDLPWHGKSSPPEGWQEESYQLTSDRYADTILTVSRAMGAARPLVMGCSIGGRIVLHLALKHADKIRGAIGLQSGAHVEPYYDLDWLHRSDVHGGEVCAGIVSGLVGPGSRSGTAGKHSGTTCRVVQAYSKGICISTRQTAIFVRRCPASIRQPAPCGC